MQGICAAAAAASAAAVGPDVLEHRLPGTERQRLLVAPCRMPHQWHSRKETQADMIVTPFRRLPAAAGMSMEEPAPTGGRWALLLGPPRPHWLSKDADTWGTYSTISSYILVQQGPRQLQQAAPQSDNANSPTPYHKPPDLIRCAASWHTLPTALVGWGHWCIMQPAGGCKTQALCKDSCAAVPSSDRQGHGPEHSCPVAYSLTRRPHTQLVGVCQVTQCVGCSEWVAPLAADEASPLPTLPGVHPNFLLCTQTHVRRHSNRLMLRLPCGLACRAALPHTGAECWCRPPPGPTPHLCATCLPAHTGPYKGGPWAEGDTDTMGRHGVCR